MGRRGVGVVVGVLLVAVACGSVSSGGSVAVGDPRGAWSGPDGGVGEVFAVATAGEVAAESFVAEGASGGTGGVLELVSASVDALAVRWAASFGAGALLFRLRWREHSGAGWGAHPAPGEGYKDLLAPAREHTIGALKSATRYEVRLEAIGAPGSPAAGAVWETLWSPVLKLAAQPLAHDAVRLTWDGPKDWAPVRYVARWRLGAGGAERGRQYLPSGARSAVITGLLGGGNYHFDVTALTVGAWQSAPAAIGAILPAAPSGLPTSAAGADGIVVDPPEPGLAIPLRLQVSAPTYCRTGEGKEKKTNGHYVRTGVESVAVQWRIDGGKAPYTIHIGDTRTTGTEGTTDISCARPGINLTRLTNPATNVVEAGTRTLPIKVTDTNGTTITQTLTIEIIEDVTSASRYGSGDALLPGKTYYLFDHYYEIPENNKIAYDGSVESDHIYDIFLHIAESPHRPTVGRVTADDGKEAARILQFFTEDGSRFDDDGEPLTSAENAMWDRFFAAIRPTPFHPKDTRRTQPTPLWSDATSGDGAQAAVVVERCTNRHGKVVAVPDPAPWRPYGGLFSNALTLHRLTCNRLIAVHPKLLAGESILVCLVRTAKDDALGSALQTAVNEWNELLAPVPDPKNPTVRDGLGYPVLGFTPARPNCESGLTDMDTSVVRVFDARSCHAKSGTPCKRGGTPAEAFSTKTADPPRVAGNKLKIKNAEGADRSAIEDELARLFRHELGHFLGLADYFRGCWRLVDGGVVQPSVMSYGQLRDKAGMPANQPDGTLDDAGCFSKTITQRDVDDLHAIYHPLAVSRLKLREERVRHVPPGVKRTWVLDWRVPEKMAYNALGLGVVQRSVFTRDGVTGMPDGPGDWTLVERLDVDQERYEFPGGTDVGSHEYAVVGLTRGDFRRGETPTDAARTEHLALLEQGETRTWTAGPSRRTVAPPAPLGVYALNLPVASYGKDTAGEWRFAFWGRTVNNYKPKHGSTINLSPGDLVVSYGQDYAGFDASPFSTANFTPINVRYGPATINVSSCDAHFWNNGRYECQIEDAFTWVESTNPLRVIVTAAGNSPSDPLGVAGTHELQPHFFDVADFGLFAPAEWRFAFWGRTILRYKPKHGSRIDLRPGSVVISYGQDYDGLDKGPFVPVPPLQIRYGTTTVNVQGCAAHFWNSGRYECQLSGNPFTWNPATAPAEITVNYTTFAANDPAGSSTTTTATSQPTTTPTTPPPTFITTCPTSDLECD